MGDGKMMLKGELAYQAPKLDAKERKIFRQLLKNAEEIERKYDCKNCVEKDSCNEGAKCYKDRLKAKRWEVKRSEE